jgi:hypothetical protein
MQTECFLFDRDVFAELRYYKRASAAKHFLPPPPKKMRRCHAKINFLFKLWFQINAEGCTCCLINFSAAEYFSLLFFSALR